MSSLKRILGATQLRALADECAVPWADVEAALARANEIGGGRRRGGGGGGAGRGSGRGAGAGRGGGGPATAIRTTMGPAEAASAFYAAAESNEEPRG